MAAIALKWVTGRLNRKIGLPMSSINAYDDIDYLTSRGQLAYSSLLNVFNYTMGDRRSKFYFGLTDFLFCIKYIFKN